MIIRFKNYSNVDDGCPEGAVEAPVWDGVTLFPEKLEWKREVKK